MRKSARVLSAFLVSALVPAVASAHGWIKTKAAYSSDYRNAGLGGGGTLDDARNWTLDGQLSSGTSASGDPPVETRASDLGGGLTYDPATALSGSLNGSYSSDGGGQSSLGGTASLSLHGKWGGFKPELTLTGGGRSYTVSQSVTVTGRSGRTVNSRLTQTLSQDQAGAELDLGLGKRVSLDLSITDYRYNQDPSAPGSTLTLGRQSVPVPPAGKFGGSLLSGVLAWEWSAGIQFEVADGSRLGASYSESRSALDGSWLKSAGADATEDIGDDWSLKEGWSKAVEGGSNDPVFSLALTYYFNDGPKL